MKPNHTNLPVHDVEMARDFLIKHFGMVTVFEVCKNFLATQQDESGFVLNLSHFDKKSTAEVQYHEEFHVGFFVETRAEVDRVYAHLAADVVAADPPKPREGRYGFYVTAPAAS